MPVIRPTPTAKIKHPDIPDQIMIIPEKDYDYKIHGPRLDKIPLKEINHGKKEEMQEKEETADEVVKPKRTIKK